MDKQHQKQASNERKTRLAGCAAPIALLAAMMLLAQPTLAAGGPGGGGRGGGGMGGGGMGGGGAHGFGGSRGGSLRIPGHRGGINGFSAGQRDFRETGSGFGYNGGIYGQGTYLPFNSTRCLVRTNGPDGPGVARVC